MSEKPGIVTVYLQLMKLRVVILLQITAICAIIAHDLMVRSDSISGDRTWLDTLEACVVTLIGGTLAAGGSNAINMVYDKDIDPGMSRTRTRPIPNGWISPNHALVFGIIIALLGSAIFIPFHWKAAFWSIFSVLFYVFVYTIWLKRRTPQNIVIGGIAGSTPPLIGWIVASANTIPENINPNNYLPYAVPGLEILISVVIITIVGGLSLSFLGKKILKLIDDLFKRIPFLRTIYSAILQMTETFSNSKNDKKSVVLIEYPRKGVWAVGFATKENKGEMAQKTNQKLISVFVPTTPNPTSGFLLMFPIDEVIYLDMTFEEASKFIVSAGTSTGKN